MALNAVYAALICLTAAEAAAGAEVIYQPVSLHNDGAGGQTIVLSWRIAATCSSRVDKGTGAPGEQESFEVQESACGGVLRVVAMWTSVVKFSSSGSRALCVMSSSASLGPTS